MIGIFKKKRQSLKLVVERYELLGNDNLDYVLPDLASWQGITIISNRLSLRRVSWR